MIVKGNIRTNGSSLGSYLLSEGCFEKNKEKNERIEVWEANGYEQGDRLQDILADFEHSATGTQCEKPLFHVQIRAGKDEQLTRDQFLESVNRLEEKLELTGHERVIVAHTLEGQEHLHVVWNRIDHEQEKAAELHYYKHKCTDLARELEKEFGLRELSSEKQKGKLSRDEEQQAIRHDEKPQEIKAAVRECWEQSDSGKAFVTALDDRGYLLAAGDRRDYVIVDELGGTYSPARLTGSKAAQVRERLSDIDREALPSVAEAKEMQQDRGHGIRSDKKEREWEEALAKAAIEKEKLAEKERKRLQKEEKERKRALAKKKRETKLTTLYSKADMVSVQKDALWYIEEKRRRKKEKVWEEEKAWYAKLKLNRQDRAEKKALRAQAYKEKEEAKKHPEKQQETKAHVQGVAPAQQQKEPQQKPEKKLERQEERKQEKQQEEQNVSGSRRDFWQKMQSVRDAREEARETKNANTEQTATQQRKAAREALREQSDQQRGRQGGAGRTRDDEERERER